MQLLHLHIVCLLIIIMMPLWLFMQQVAMLTSLRLNLCSPDIGSVNFDA